MSIFFLWREINCCKNRRLHLINEMKAMSCRKLNLYIVPITILVYTWWTFPSNSCLIAFLFLSEFAWLILLSEDGAVSIQWKSYLCYLICILMTFKLLKTKRGWIGAIMTFKPLVEHCENMTFNSWPVEQSGPY